MKWNKCSRPFPSNKGAPNVCESRDGSACYQAKAWQRHALGVHVEACCVHASSTLPLIFTSISAASRRVLITSTGPLVRGTSEYWLDSSIVLRVGSSLKKERKMIFQLAQDKMIQLFVY